MFLFIFHQGVNLKNYLTKFCETVISFLYLTNKFEKYLIQEENNSFKDFNFFIFVLPVFFFI